MILSSSAINAQSYRSQNENINNNVELDDRMETDSEDCCDPTKHKKNCNSQKLCSIISKVNMLKSQISTIDTKIDKGFANVEADLDEIIELQEVQTSKLDVCCAQLNSKIDALVIGACDLSPVNSRLDACCFTLNTKINTLTNIVNTGFDDTFLQLNRIEGELNSCCTTLNSKVDLLITRTCPCDPCVPTPVFGQTTLSLAGIYCLANNINGEGADPAITIAHSSITLDLNGHEVSHNLASGDGIRCISGGVVIKNGNVGQGITNSGRGIFLDGSLGKGFVEIEDVFVNGWSVGILSTMANTNITNSDISNGVAGVILTTTLVGTSTHSANNSCITNCKITSNLGAVAPRGGIILSAGAFTINNVHISDCTLDNNSFGINFSPDSTGYRCIDITNCKASGNSVTGFGINTGTDIFIRDCTACRNGIGFRSGSTNGPSGLNILNCVAKGNVQGFRFDRGDGIVRGCTGDDNTSNGFVQFSPANFQFYSNAACNNGPTGITNFTGVTSAQVTSPANARGVKNIDCSNSAIDQVEQTLSKVCVLESKLDVFDSCNPTPVFRPTTLSLAGTYCLAHDIIGTSTTGLAAILISGPYITLDLNGHNIGHTDAIGEGIRVNSFNVVIKNGSVSKFNTNPNTPGSFGIALTALPLSSTVTIENVQIDSWGTGIFSNVANTNIVDCDVSYNAFVGINLSTSALNNNTAEHSCIKGCKITSNAANGDGGIILNTVGNDILKAVHISDCTLDENPFGITTLGNCQCIEITNCQINGNENSVVGFNISNGSEIFIRDCTSCNNAVGFRISLGTDIASGVNISNCTAKFNLTGFLLNNGDGSIRGCVADENDTGFNAVEGTFNIQECTSLLNTTTGFVGNATSIFYLNSATLNGQNYAGVVAPSAPIKTLTDLTRLYGDNLADVLP